MSFRPRKRAKPKIQRINAWPDVSEKAVLGFAGYKVGMATAAWTEERPGPTKGMEVLGGVTVVETPSLVVYGARFYNNGYSKDVLTDDADVIKRLGAKKARASSTAGKESKEAKEGNAPESFTDVKLLAFAQPTLTPTGKKHVERMELALGGSSLEEKASYALSLLGKELKVADVLKPGMFVDVIAVTKGKGWQGPVKRFGVAKQRRKATGKVRHVGTLGPFKPGYVQYTAPQAGQMGLHKRTELNKWLLKVGKAEKAESINPAGGWPHYGLVKNDFVVIKGSIPGTIKRVVRFRWAMRKPTEVVEPKLSFIRV